LSARDKTANVVNVAIACEMVDFHLVERLHDSLASHQAQCFVELDDLSTTAFSDAVRHLAALNR
jgi:hypothetical protein